MPAVMWRNGLRPTLALPPGTATAGATAINNTGQVGGFASSTDGSQTWAVRWTHGEPELLANPPDGLSAALGINDQGTVAGYTVGPDGLQAAIWDGLDPEILPGLSPGAETLAFDINTRGEVAGSSAVIPLGDIHAVVWRAS